MEKEIYSCPKCNSEELERHEEIKGIARVNYNTGETLDYDYIESYLEDNTVYCTMCDWKGLPEELIKKIELYRIIDRDGDFGDGFLFSRKELIDYVLDLELSKSHSKEPENVDEAIKILDEDYNIEVKLVDKKCPKCKMVH